MHVDRGCPFCAAQQVCPCQSLATLRPDLASEWHPEKNGALTPAAVTYGSKKKVGPTCTAACPHAAKASTL